MIFKNHQNNVITLKLNGQSYEVAPTTNVVSLDQSFPIPIYPVCKTLKMLFKHLLEHDVGMYYHKTDVYRAMTVCRAMEVLHTPQYDEQLHSLVDVAIPLEDWLIVLACLDPRIKQFIIYDHIH